VERLRRCIGNPLTLSKTETFAGLTEMIIHRIGLTRTSRLPRLSKRWLIVSSRNTGIRAPSLHQFHGL